MGGFLDDLFSTGWDAVTGLNDSMEGALTATINTVNQIEQTITLVVKASLGQVSWQDVLNSAGKVFQDVGQALVYLDPSRQLYNFLSTSPLTAHPFAELDKFTGGMITNAANLSDLPARVLAGEAIPKTELLRDALFAIEVVMIVVTFPEGLCVMAAMLLGKEVCSHQTQAQNACMAAFMIAGLAMGDFVDADEQSIIDSFTQAGQQYITSQGIGVATQKLTLLCQKQGWGNSQECQVIADVFTNYVMTGGDMDWPRFLANELVKLGKQDLLKLFPKNSPEYIAINNAITIQLPPGTAAAIQASSGPNWVINTVQPPTGGIWLLAAGAAAILLGVS